MKKLLTLISIILIISCDVTEPDTTPPTVTITYPVSGQTVYEMTLIEVLTQDNKGIEKVEFYINDSLHFVDMNSPYQYNWNTTDYEDNTENIIKVISYDNSNNHIESQPIMLIVNNSTSYPQSINIISVEYNFDEMYIIWNRSMDNDFNNYDLYTNNNILLKTTSDINDTTYTLTDFNPTFYNWFWIEVFDTIGYSTVGEQKSNNIDNPPTPVLLDPVIYDNNQFVFSWSENTNIDFSSYILYESDSPNMNDENEIVTIQNSSVTNYVMDVQEDFEYKYFRVKVVDYWGLNSSSSIQEISFYVKFNKTIQIRKA